MTKKKIFILVGILMSIGIIAGLIFVNRKRLFVKKEVQKIEHAISTQTPKEEVLTWDDPAGFTFQYPKGLTIDKHDEDQDNYAHIEFTDSDHKGSVIVWAKDTTAIAISQWLKNEKTLKDQSFVDTALGGNDAVKMLVKDPKKKQIIATLDEDVLVMVEATLDDEEFWQKISDTIVGSFKFSMNQTNVTGDQSTAPSDEPPPAEADEEETVE